MIELPKRQFEASPGERRQCPLWVGLFGPSGGGKTYSALRLGSAIARVMGGPLYGIDTEANRMLHYADKFQFTHVPMGEPFGSLDYLAALQFVLGHNKSGHRPTIIVDSTSHEHEGPGGMMEMHDKIATRMAIYDGKFDPKKYERVKMLAWAEPKAHRRALINGMLRMEANFILCFRAKESSVPVQKVEQGNNGRTFTKTEVVNQGFVPIGGDDFVYECTLATLLPPAAKGVPNWKPELVGERRMVKVPEQFHSVEELQGVPLDEALGEQLARWALGGKRAATSASPEPAADQTQQSAPSRSGPKSNKDKAVDWVDWFIGELKLCDDAAGIQQLRDENSATIDRLRSFPELHTKASNAVDDALAAL
jgi:hypothetical protein